MMLHLFLSSGYLIHAVAIFLAILVLQTFTTTCSHAGFISCIFLRTITTSSCAFTLLTNVIGSTTEKQFSCPPGIHEPLRHLFAGDPAQLLSARQSNLFMVYDAADTCVDDGFATPCNSTDHVSQVAGVRHEKESLDSRTEHTHACFQHAKIFYPAFAYCALGHYLSQICVDLFYI